MPAISPMRPDRTRRNWTVEEVHALPDDGNRYEVVDGALLVTPAPSFLHQRAVRELVARLQPAAAACGLECIFAPAEVTFSERRSVEPDLFVIPLVAGRPAARFEEVRRLVLAVEVLSPSSARADRYIKRRLYQDEGVSEYWIVEPAARLVERWRAADEEPDVLIDSLTWTPREGAESLVIDLAEYFRRVHGEAVGAG